jgi:hypothetical protein
MKRHILKPYNVVGHEKLPEISVDKIPDDGDPVEISGELYFVCEQPSQQKANNPEIGVIPLVVRNPAKIPDINKYLKCLAIAHRRVQFKNEKGICDITTCDEMIIS